MKMERTYGNQIWQGFQHPDAIKRKKPGTALPKNVGLLHLEELCRLSRSNKSEIARVSAKYQSLRQQGILDQRESTLVEFAFQDQSWQVVLEPFVRPRLVSRHTIEYLLYPRN